MKCLNIIVFYDNYLEIEFYLNNLFENNIQEEIDVCIVINKDTNNVANKILEKYKKNVFLKDYNQNVGYLNALLYVIKEIDISIYAYIILSNSDITYISKNFYHTLLSAKYNHDIGCIAPSVFSLNTKSYSNPHYKTRISRSKMKKNIFIFSHPLLANIYQKLSYYKAKKKNVEEGSCYVYSPHGCFMIFSNEFIKSIIGNVYGVLLYSEESYIGEMLIKHKYKCYYDSELKINHIENAVTGKMKYKYKYRYISESLNNIMETFYK